MSDMALICFLGLFLLLMFWMMSRMMGGMSNPYGRRGGGYPPADDPNYETPTYDDPDISGRGSFGRDRGRGFPFGGSRKSGPPKGAGRTPGLGGRPDSPNISGRGSFGRDKD